MRIMRSATRCLTRVLAAIGLITVLALATPIDHWWAHAYSGSIEQPKGDVLIVLSAASDDQDLISFSSYWRARYALMAWKEGGFQKIVISGGGSPGIANFLIMEGVPRQAIVSEWHSTTTRENGVETARLIQGMPGRKILLTSDFHMFRAIRVFRKLGIDVSPMPIPDVLKASENFNGRITGFQTMTVESFKIVYYKLRGWI